MSGAAERARVLELLLAALPPEAQVIARLGGPDSLAETPYVLIWGREYDTPYTLDCEVQRVNAAGLMSPQTTRRTDARISLGGPPPCGEPQAHQVSPNFSSMVYSGLLQHGTQIIGHIHGADRSTKRAINAAAKMLGLSVYGPTRR